MDDGFALRDLNTRRSTKVKELEQDKIQRENWSFQFGEYETYNMGNGNEDGEEVAEKDGQEEAETTPEGRGCKEAYEVAGNEDEVVEGGRQRLTRRVKPRKARQMEDSPSTLQVMAKPEKLEKEVDDKAAAEKAGDELAAAEKAASDKEKLVMRRRPGQRGPINLLVRQVSVIEN
ncbi:hypothetical protein Bca52824_064420 [Brassica carinata]|uniref:Uncharacterized protein n=1 Tax=Brassica carinata TaxID=52824 RepID=A0A8X7U848_BRACI|nr:hypothetical protein Bca52824_064420 [Brassica carinata]